jgi:hypothetical protein
MYSDMTKAPKADPKKAVQEIELLPDAWPRFERMVKTIAKAGPQHREQPKVKRAKAQRKVEK